MTFEHTENFKQYQQYLELKQCFKLYHKDVDMIKACSLELLSVVALNYNATWRKIGDSLTRKLKIENLQQAFQKYNTVFSIDEYCYRKRKDHLSLMQEIQKTVDISTLIVLSHKRKFFFHFFHFFKYYQLISKQHLLKKLSFKNKCFIAATFLYCRKTVDLLQKIDSTIDYPTKNYIPLNSSTEAEAILTCFFRNKGASTFHIFHGIFGRYKRRIYTDIIAGENIIAEYSLPFGETLKQYLIQDFNLDEAKIFIAGNPKYPSKSIHLKNTFKNCIVLGGISLFDDDIAEIIPFLDEIAQYGKIKFYLKPHPNSLIMNTKSVKKAKHIKFIDKFIPLKDLFDSGMFDCAIIHNTFSYYECMYYNVFPLRWGKNEYNDFESFNDRFFDKES
jgi:hypothetical protein